MTGHGKRDGLLHRSDVADWLNDVNTRTDFGPPPTEEEFAAVQDDPDAAGTYVSNLHDPVPQELTDRLTEAPFRDGLARIWRLVTTDSLQMHVDLILDDDGVTEVEGVVLHTSVGMGTEAPFGTVPDPS